MAELTFVGVSKVFPGGVTAVDRLELTVQDGELLVLVGPSGSGKTTTLRLLAGLEQPTSGKFLIGQRDVTALPPQQRDLAMVFQQLGLYGHLTAQENMAFSLRLRQKGKWFAATGGERLSAGEIDQRVRQTAVLLGIDELLGRKPAELSGGQQQRVALGRAIVRRPQALLLDEPLASLDVPLRRALRQELRQLQEKTGLTTVYVTHDQAEAMALGDRIVVLNAGRMEQVGTPQDVYRRPATQFVAGFFGSQGMNFLTGSLERESGKGCLVSLDDSAAPVALPIETAEWPGNGNVLIDTEVTLGFRPEDALLSTEMTAGPSALEVKIVAVEYQGDFCYIAINPVQESRPNWIVRTDGSGNWPAVGQHRFLTIRPGGVHWFGRDGKRFA